MKRVDSPTKKPATAVNRRASTAKRAQEGRENIADMRREGYTV